MSSPARVAPGTVKHMPRSPRIEYPNAIHHITQRGNRRDAIFVTEADYRVYLTLLADSTQRYGWQVLSYCLMPNHLHLLLQTPEPNLSQGMRHLTGSYARAFNTTHEFVGHLFQGRYKSRLIESDEHLATAFGYIALNPVRAGLCSDAGDWPWSAHAELTGERALSGRILCDDPLGRFAQTAAEARRHYARMVDDLAGAELEPLESPVAARAGSG